MIAAITRYLRASFWEAKIALRGLFHTKRYSLSVCLILAVGFGVFASSVDLLTRTYLQPLPFLDSTNLDIVRWNNGVRVSDSLTNSQASFLHDSFGDTFASATVYGPLAGCALTSEKASHYMTYLPVQSNFFSVMGVAPAIGRVFRREDVASASWTPVVLSHRVWITRFGGNSNVINSVIRCGAANMLIVGVMPRRFDLFPHPDLWSILTLLPDPNSTDKNFKVIGRLQSGMPAAKRVSALALLNERYRSLYPSLVPMHASGFVEEPLGRWIVREARPTVTLFSLVGIMLGVLIFVNVLGLQFMHTWKQRHGRAVALALGAPRSRLMARIAWEAVILSLFACLGGAFVARVCSRTLVAAGGELITSTIPHAVITTRALIYFATAITVAVGLFGIAASLVLRDTPVSGGATEKHGPFRSVHSRLATTFLLGSQCALSLAFLIAGGSLFISLLDLDKLPLGFHTRDVASADVDLDARSYPTVERVQSFANSLVSNALGEPGVIKAAFATSGPLQPGLNVVWPTSNGASCDHVAVEYRGVSADYFSVLGINAHEGRLFSPSDFEGGPPVAIANTAFMNHCHLSRAALGATITFADDRPRTLVGVVGDVMGSEVASVAEPTVYVPFTGMSQGLVSLNDRYYNPTLIVLTRSHLPMERLTTDILGRTDPTVPLFSALYLDDRLAMLLAQQGELRNVVVTAAIAALLIACSGIYGVVAIRGSLRRRDLAIKSALGAGRRHIFIDTTADILLIGALSIPLGVLGGVFLNHWFASMQPWIVSVPRLLCVIVAAVVAATIVIISAAPLMKVFREQPASVLRV